MILPKGRKSTGDVSLPYREARQFLEWYCKSNLGITLKPVAAIKVLVEGNFDKGVDFPSTPRGIGKWLEVMGCGMVDPAVLEGLGIDSERWTGFAAGLGVERFCMVRHGIDDIRRLYTSDLRFLEQF